MGKNQKQSQSQLQRFWQNQNSYQRKRLHQTSLKRKGCLSILKKPNLLSLIIVASVNFEGGGLTKGGVSLVKPCDVLSQKNRSIQIQHPLTYLLISFFFCEFFERFRILLNIKI